MQALYTRISLHKSNINLPESRKLDVSKYLYKCSNRSKTMPISATNNYSLLQIKEKTS